MQILKPGNNDGYSFIDACLSIFIAGILLLTVLSFSKVIINYSNKISLKTDIYINHQNDYSNTWMETFEK